MKNRVATLFILLAVATSTSSAQVQEMDFRAPEGVPEAASPKTGLNAGIFRQPPVYVPPGTPTNRATELQNAMRSLGKGPLLQSADVPTFVPGTGLLTLPKVSADGVVYETTLIRRQTDGTFAVVNTPQIMQGQPITPANYRDGTLVLTEMFVGKTRYTNVTFRLNSQGLFELVDSFQALPVAATSYENAKSIVLTDPNLPRPSAAGVALTPVNENWFQGGSVGRADFFQEGAYSAVAQLTEWKSAADIPRMAPNAPAKIVFLRQDSQGRWVDQTSRLLSDTTGCISPRKAVVADFNADRKPDVFFACSGFDGDPSIPDRPPYGDNQRLLLSRVDGRYENIKLPFVGYGHGATAADLNGDRLPDLIVTNTSCQTTEAYCNPNAVTSRTPYVLINEGGGRFRVDTTRFPTAPDTRFETLQYWGIYELELIDTRRDGKPDLFVGGSPAEFARGCLPCAKNGILRNDGNGFFNRQPMVEFPLSTSPSGKVLGNALDFVLVGNHVFFHQDVPGASSPEMAVQRVDLRNYSVQTVWTKQGRFIGGETWPVWLYPTSDGRIRSREVNCDYPIHPESVCAVSIPVNQ